MKAPTFFIAWVVSIGWASLGHAQTDAPLPLFGTGERVLFQGDSITDMGRGRTEDPNHILGHGYAFLIAARHGNAYPERGTVFLNRGISGSTVRSLGERWQKDTLELKPDVLSVLIGINDVFFSMQSGKPFSLPEMEQRYDGLLSAAQEQNPQLKLILGEPFILPGTHTQEKWEAWREAVSQVQDVTARLAKKHGAAVVHYQRVFDEAVQRAPVAVWIWDGIHPTYAGHQLMADEWQRVYAEHVIPMAPSNADNTAVVPVPKLERDSYDWYERHFSVLQIQQTIRPEIVLIGDSITHFWSGEPRAKSVNGAQSWEAAFSGKRVLNLGFGWDRTQNVLWRLEHGELNGLTPKAIVLNIGTNNLTGTANARTNTPEEVVEAITLIVRKLRAEVPEAKILVMGVFPRGTEASALLRAPIKAINQLLPAALKGDSHVGFIDIGEKFLSPDGTLSKDVMPDGTHPNEKGYAIWADALAESGILNAR